MKSCATIVLIFVFVHAGWSCVWVTGTKYNSERVSVSGFSDANRLRSFLKEDLKIEGSKMERNLRGAQGFNERSDYAVALMYLGRSGEAIKLLQALEKEQPGQYFVAANLGTAFELSGNNEEALHWIKEGIRRNPDSHEGTEWLHATILEAKIAHEKNADYFKHHSVLELQPQTLGAKIILGKQEFSPEEVGRAIQY